MCGFPPQILPIMAPGYGNTSWYFRKEEKFLSWKQSLLVL